MKRLTMKSLREKMIKVLEDLYNKDHVTEEHWIPRTTVGKIIADAIVYGTDDYDALNGDCSLENIYRWIDTNTHLFCSIIISSKEENKTLNDLTKKFPLLSIIPAL